MSLIFIVSRSMFISLPSSARMSAMWSRKVYERNKLNLRARRPGLAASARGNIFTSIFMVLLAFGGSMAKKLRAVLPDLGLKGEKAVLTEVKNLVIIVAARKELYL